MEQKRPVMITSEEIAKLPILIVDKKGLFGSALAKLLRDQFLAVVVTAGDLEAHENVIHVPYRKKIPTIPDNAYSHIFVFYNGEPELLDMMPAFEEKAEAVNARLLFITSLLHSDKKVFLKLQHTRYRLLQTVIFGETFNNAITEANEINFFIHQARSYGRIEIPKEGLGILYPILFDDVLSSLVSLAFALEKPTEIIYLFPHHVYNEISVARIIKKIDPTIKIDFSKRKNPTRRYYIPPDGLYFYRDYNLEDRLRKISLVRTKNSPKLPQKKIHLRLNAPKVQQSRWMIFWAVLAAVFIAPLLLVLCCALVGAGFLTFSVKQAEQGNFPTAITTGNIAQQSFTATQVLSPSALLPLWIFPQQTAMFFQTMQTGETFSTTEVSFIQAIQLMKNIYDGKSTDPKSDFLQASTTIQNALVVIQKMEAEKNLPQEIVQKLHGMDDAINLVEETIATWPTLLGFDGNKKYLILFQNNMELRPGGGFIGSYGILPVDNGRVGKLQISDVYDADGHLRTQIPPPYGLQRYLGVSHWFLRDSNFDPDFTQDAAQATRFLQLETQQTVDGVIGIDTAFLKNLISVVGPVTLPDYNITVTPDNFYMVTETNAEKNFFPGSTQKKDFLRSLADALLNKLSTEKKIPFEKFAQMIISSIQQKDLLVAFSNPGIQNVYTVNDFSSSLWDGRHYAVNTLYDFFGVVDANLGTNKTNLYIKRSINQMTGIDDTGAIRTTATITYTNTSNRTSPLGGDYRDYVRFLIPIDATLESVAFNNQQVQTTPAITDPAIFTTPNFTPPPGLEVDQTQEQGETAVGFFFVVPETATKTISITYTLPGSLDTSNVAFSYDLRLFKQPGANNDPYQLTLSYPNDFAVLREDKALTNVGGKLIYDDPLSQDKDVMVSFTKK